jgi:hypothetical protein
MSPEAGVELAAIEQFRDLGTVPKARHLDGDAGSGEGSVFDGAADGRRERVGDMAEANQCDV